MAERGNTTHGQNLDDQMKHETQGLEKGMAPAQREEFLETEPLPDDTDPPEVQDAFRGEQVDPPVYRADEKLETPVYRPEDEDGPE
jgi:hypothetical protein